MKALPVEVVTFLESMIVPGVLSTLKPDGSPITSAVWFGFYEGDIIISTPAGRNKAKNARADSRVSFLVDTRERPYRGVVIEGDAELLDDRMGTLARLIGGRYLGAESEAWAEARSSMPARVILRIRPRRVRPWNMAAGDAAQQVQ